MRILMPVDGSGHNRAALAFLLGRRSWLEAEKPEIELAHVRAPLPSRFAEVFTPEQIRAMHEEAAEEVLNPLVAEVRAANIPNLSTKVLVGSPGMEITEEAEETDADLIVMGARGYSLIDSMIVGSVSQAVIAKSEKPVLICHDAPPPKEESLVVGVAVDGSGSSDAALDFILKHKAFFGPAAQFRILYVVPDYQGIMQKHLADAMIRFIPEIPILETEDFREVTDPVLAKFEAAGIHAVPVMLRGEPGPTVVEYAERELGMIVAGSHGKGNLRALFMGTTARHIAAFTRCPMLVVRGV